MSTPARPRVVLVGLTAGALFAPVVASVTAVSAAADKTYYVPITKTWAISGRGYGHGSGLSQYGAQGAALKGLGYPKILSFYYPGTSFAKVHGRVRVLISADTTSDLQVRPHRGLRVRHLGRGGSWRLPVRTGIVRWRLVSVPNGRTAVEYLNRHGWHRWASPHGRKRFRGDGEFSARGPLTLLVPGGSGLVERRYPGAMRSVPAHLGGRSRDTVNVLRIDAYVRGVVPYEMPASWRPEALRAQAVAARTYAAWERRQNRHRYYQICDTTDCQAYGGASAQQASTNAAVRATAKRILTFHSRPAFTQFSASSGGWTAAGGEPYLPSKRDRFDSYPGNPVHRWAVTVSAAKLERAHPGIGRLVDVRVTRRDGHGAWNGRVRRMVLEGTKGKTSISGDDFRWTYGLRSSWFRIAPTPIMHRWHRVGGRKSALGRPISGEFPVSTGSAQKFSSGRIYWSPRHGARELVGACLRAYRKWGGPTSNLGWPATGMMKAPHRGHKVRFASGSIYSHRHVGAHVVNGRILTRWSRAGAVGSWLGYPTSDVHRVKGGQRATFQHGVITWHRRSNRFTLRRS